MAGVASQSWVVVSLIGAVLFSTQEYDLWDDVDRPGWSPLTTVVETGVLFFLALGLVYGGSGFASGTGTPSTPGRQ